MSVLLGSAAAVAQRGMAFKDWFAVGKDAATVLALLVGGLFTYFKFIKGRVLGPRAILTLSTTFVAPPRQRFAKWGHASSTSTPRGRAVGVELCIHNAGQIQLRLARNDQVLLTISSITAEEAFSGVALTQLAQSWKRSDAYFAETNVLLEEGEAPADDVPLEPGEDARFAAVFAIPASHQAAAYLVTVNCRLTYRSWFVRRGRWWDSRILVTPDGKMRAGSKTEVSG